MSATATELAEKTPAQHRYHEANERHYSNREVEMAAGAFDRAEEVHAEHDRMILDLQQTIADVVQESIAIDGVTRIGCEIESFHELFYLQDKQIKELGDSLRKADDFAVGMTAFVQSLQAKVIELNASVDDLMAGSGVVTKTSPQIRVRLQHTSTVKEGWRLGESTVEFVSGNDGEIDWNRIDVESRFAFAIGDAEATRRNNVVMSE